MTKNKFIALGLTAVLFLMSGCSAFKVRDDEDKAARQAKLYLQLAVDHFNRREYNKAVENTFKALKKQPKFPKAYNHLALVYMETRRYKKSERAFRKALSQKKDFPEVYNNMGVLMNRQGKYQQAIGFFQKALSFEKYVTPQNALTNLGYSFYKMGKLSHAKRYHQKALDIMPQFCLAHKNVGDIYAKEKKFGRALKSYETATTHCPLYQEAMYKKSLALMKMGRRKQARSELKTLVTRHKSGPYVRRSNEVLKYLQ